MEGIVSGTPLQFIELNTLNIIFLIVLGFLGGLASGFVGSGGAFVLTPGMMNLGVPATIAVASNMCHKFPKAMVGAYRRFRFGQLDIKLGLILAVTAIIGVQIGIQIQEMVLNRWGEAGSGLYVSLAFVIILTIIGIYMFIDSRKSMKSGEKGEAVSRLARFVQRVRIPPMIHFKRADTTVSLWVTVPVGLACGLMAATIAVGGFVGVPGMIYLLGVPSLVASATEMLVAFGMGLVGTVTYGLHGFVDIRMVLLILAGSLFGVQLGAIGTTYVKSYMVKYVMSTMMILVSISRIMAIPKYLNDLGIMSFQRSTTSTLDYMSFGLMCLAMLIGGVIIIGSIVKGRRALSRQRLEVKRLEAPTKTYSWSVAPDNK
jgi:uncharacterized membrane protein YfcA